MRLPWPFGRAQRSPSGDASGDAPVDGGSAVSAALPARADGAWRKLPPLAETLGPPPLVAPNRPFAAGLASNEPPPPILAPLSHGRSLEAPKGLVSGIARPTSTVAAPALPAPVQRSPLGGRRAADLEPDPEPAGDGGSEAGSPAPPSAAPITSPDPVPIRRLEPVIAALPISARPSLTRAPEGARPVHPIGLVGQARAAGTSAPISAGVQRSPAGAEPPTAPAPPATTAPAETPVPSAAPIAAPPRLTIGQARRLGLGAPVAGGPATTATPLVGGSLGPGATASGTRVAAASASATPAVPGVQRSPGTGDGPLPLAAAAGAVPRDHADDGPAASPGIGSGAAATPVAEPVPARPIGPAPQRSAIGPTSPIVSAQPLRPGVQRAPAQLVQRAPEGGQAGAPATSSAGVPTSQGPVKVHRDGRAGALSNALDARSFTHGGEIFLPASHGPLSSGTGKALLAHELTHVAQQRRLGSSLPAEHSPHGRSLEAEAVAAERAPDLTLAMPPSQPVTLPGSGPVRPAASPDGGPAAGTQRAPAGTTASAARTSGGGSSQTSAGGGRESRHSHSEEELEVLAHQLYHRIGRHLRRELLVDRERVGFALDLP